MVALINANKTNKSSFCQKGIRMRTMIKDATKIEGRVDIRLLGREKYVAVKVTITAIKS